MMISSAPKRLCFSTMIVSILFSLSTKILSQTEPEQGKGPVPEGQEACGDGLANFGKKSGGRFFVPLSMSEFQDKLETALEKFDEDERDQALRNLNSKVSGDLSKVEFNTENIDSITGFGRGAESIVGYQILANGMPYLGITAGGDWEDPIFFIIYWDGKSMRGYIPEDGNIWNTDLKSAYGNDEEADLVNREMRAKGRTDGWKVDQFHAELIKADIQKRILKRE